ncbi:enoyl-CoA hydratase/isomerase family protein [Mycolicibacterium mageritense]|uniref:Carnitinyl-CoA dehydratase n=1 Tax=Mycolicibacterium mageritense TaxID=53462 RepID=A0AAI8TUF8_MYCME|nr:enoyl-CoA hydratase/isomerase family protein [Mycolicibacterium mageritense]BDY28973.1 Carnitinyl-CoA dehydratase [Mycolicibacterium mageritense]
MSPLATGQSATLATADHDGVLVVALDRPPANAMNRQLIHDLAGLFEHLRARPDAPPIVLTGQGERFFSAGGDIKELEGAHAGEIEIRMREFHALLVAMDRYPRPVVSAINGHCVGGGMEVAVFSDSVLAVSSARFGFPEINHGLLPADKGIQRANQVLGVRVTRRIILSGELFDAQHAVDIGLVDELVTDPGELIPVAVATARTAGSKAPVLYGALKSSVNDADDVRDEASLQRTLRAAAAYFDDPVARELRQRWSGRRAPAAKVQSC